MCEPKITSKYIFQKRVFKVKKIVQFDNLNSNAYRIQMKIVIPKYQQQYQQHNFLIFNLFRYFLVLLILWRSYWATFFVPLPHYFLMNTCIFPSHGLVETIFFYRHFNILFVLKYLPS